MIFVPGWGLAPADDPRLVYVARFNVYDRWTGKFVDLWAATKTLQTNTFDVPPAALILGVLRPPNVKVSVIKGENLTHFPEITIGDLKLISPRIDPNDPSGLEGLLDEWASRYRFKSGTVTGSYGQYRTDGGSLAFVSTYTEYFKATIDDFQPTRQELTCRLKPLGLDMKAPLLLEQYGKGKLVVLQIDLSDEDWDPTQVSGGTAGGSIINDIPAYQDAMSKVYKMQLLFDDLFGVLKPGTWGECYGIEAQKISESEQIYQWDGIHRRTEGLVELFEGGLGTSEGGPAINEDPAIYGVNGFKLDAPPDKPLNMNVKGKKALGKNLFLDSNDTSTGNWTRSNVTVDETDTSNPDPLQETGFSQAVNKITATAANGYVEQIWSLPAGELLELEDFIVSFYFRVGALQSHRVEFDFIGGIVDADSKPIVYTGSGIPSEGVSVGGGWYRFDWLRTTTPDNENTGVRFRFYPDDIGSSGFAWFYGSQLERRPGYEDGKPRISPAFYKETTDSTIEYFDKSAEILEDIFYNRIGVGPNTMDLESWARYQRRYPYKSQLWASKKTNSTRAKAITKLLAPAGFIVTTREGRLLLGWLREPYDPVNGPDATFEAAAIGSYKERRIPPVYHLKIGWREVGKKLNPDDFVGAATGENRALFEEEIRWVERGPDRGIVQANPEARILEVKTALVNEADAISLADEMWAIYSVERRVVTTPLRKKFYDADIYQTAAPEITRFGIVSDAIVDWLESDGTAIQFDDGSELLLENPAAGRPGVVVGLVDNPMAPQEVTTLELYI